MYKHFCKVWHAYAKINNTSVHSRTPSCTRVGLRTRTHNRHWC